MTVKTFEDLNLVKPLLRVLKAENYIEPTPIQTQAIPMALNGKDILGIAQTGTGKTAAFGLPILQILSKIETRPITRSTRALVLAPTRELVIQIGDAIRTYGREVPLRYTVIYGGVSQNPQVKAMKRGVDILVATPGRLLDLIEQRFIRLDQVTHFVLDEADRMLDMGFINDVNKIVDQLPKARQTLFFSATMPSAVSSLANKILHNPSKISVAPTATPIEKIEQSVFFVRQDQKRARLENLLGDQNLKRAIVFTRTKHRANRVCEQINKLGIESQALHGNKSQAARQRALEAFRKGEVKVLVATDIAARGIDVDGITHIINFELPNVPEDYVHRIGRTARAGAHGTAISLCDPSEQPYLRDIEKLIKQILVSGGEPSNDETKPTHKNSKRQQNEGPQNNKSRKVKRFHRRRSARAA
ncbi:DEAD/DEAH box helicase [Alphaproteobacteria bacterium]|nr:DEAD/DEAH box helicase [Alphaproteobacteria bacterium]